MRNQLKVREIQKENSEQNLQSLLFENRTQIENALPKHVTVARLLSVAMIEVRKNPRLLECTRASFVGAMLNIANLGLEPGSARGLSYLIPYRNKETKTYEVNVIIGYKGMIELAYRSPRVLAIEVNAVFEKDKFKFEKGLKPILKHVPHPDGEGDQLTHAYVVVTLAGGVKVFDVMTRREVDDARARSPSPSDGPWVTDFPAMAMKSVVRRFFKYMPASAELATAITFDEAGERGEQFNTRYGEEITGIEPEEKASLNDKFDEDFADEIPPDDFDQAASENEPAQRSFGGFITR